jgi:hypothetical protein
MTERVFIAPNAAIAMTGKELSLQTRAAMVDGMDRLRIETWLSES